MYKLRITDTYTIFINYEIIVFHRSINEIKNRYRNNYIVIDKSITFWVIVAFFIIQFLCSLSTFVHWTHPRDTKIFKRSSSLEAEPSTWFDQRGAVRNGYRIPDRSSVLRVIFSHDRCQGMPSPRISCQQLRRH